MKRKHTSNTDTAKNGRVDISTADDINVDEDNAVGSPKKALTAEAPDIAPEDAVEPGKARSAARKPRDE